MSKRDDSVVFAPGRMGALEIKNRLVRSATLENAATVDGEVSDALIGIHRTLAAGGVGLIITGIFWFYPDSPAPPHVARADRDSFIPGMQRLSRAVHETAPDCKIMLQLQHPGRQVTRPEDRARILAVRSPAYRAFIRKHPAVIAHPQGPSHVPEPIAPSPIRDSLFERVPRALTLDEVERVVDTCAESIRRAQEAGFDGVQLHAAHGWLFSSFLSPRTNQRVDRYGGSTENRTRIVTEIFRRARTKVGNRFPILIKMNTTDFLPGGTDLEEAIRVATILAETGFDAVEVSGGMWEAVTRTREELGWLPVLLPESRTGIKTIDQEGYFLPAARAIKDKTSNTVISVGGYRSLSKIEETLASNVVDFVSLCRPLIRQPELPRLWYTGTGPDRAECISCNACSTMGSAVLTCRAKLGARNERVGADD